MTIVKNAFTVRAQSYSVLEPEQPGSAPSYNAQHAPRVDLEVRVEDARLKEQLDGFDGLERGFALVPRRDGDALRWDRHELAFQATSNGGYFGERRFDVHSIRALSDVDLEAIRTHGIAVGVETNQGTVWAQAPDENFRAEVRRTGVRRGIFKDLEKKG